MQDILLLCSFYGLILVPTILIHCPFEHALLLAKLHRLLRHPRQARTVGED